ncbi:biopolymer transporter ExbD [Paraflavisolibacter sp. H34]|uniref:ExbD/TolR family protein n=1 Tax=Huijunlia imazamoxiresistens TaxID=3127457 RepID=UPI0030183C7D
MAQMDVPAVVSGKKHRTFRPSLRVDMTPMVDLGFLLITFFILTSTMAESRVAQLAMPADGPPSKAPESNTISVLLGKDNKAYVYYGRWEEAVQQKKVFATSYNLYTGLGAFVRAKQKQMADAPDQLIYLIKPSDESTYENVIDALDEATINGIKRYAVVPLSPEEKTYVASAPANHQATGQPAGL